MKEKAYITPVVLEWARRTARISIEDAASKIPSCTPARLADWENGREFPTIKQAEKLAKIYKRPLAVLYLPEIPWDFQTLKDFRAKNAGKFSTALIFMMREIQEKQKWVSELYSDSGEPRLDYIGRFNSTSSAEQVARDIRRTLEIVTNEIDEPLRYWVKKAEARRIFVSQSSFFHSRLTIDPEEVKGFAISDFQAPFVFINSADYENAQLFTLLHEIAHLWINESGISSTTEISLRSRQPSYLDPVEKFCNEVAANALIPSDELVERIGNIRDLTFEGVRNAARTFGVSTIPFLIRSVNLDLISESQFNQYRKQAEIEFQDYLKRKSASDEKEKGGPNYYILQVRRNSKSFSQVVIDFYKGGHITGVEASNLLNVKVNNFPKYEHYVYR